jgi:hypothetical protein
MTLSSKPNEVTKSTNSFKEPVTVINESNKNVSELMKDKTFKDRTTSGAFGQLKVTMIRIDENLSFGIDQVECRLKIDSSTYNVSSWSYSFDFGRLIALLFDQ